MSTDRKYEADSRDYSIAAKQVESCRVDPEERLQTFSEIRDKAARAEQLLLELDESPVHVPGLDLLKALGSVRHTYLNACTQVAYWLAEIDK